MNSFATNFRLPELILKKMGVGGSCPGKKAKKAAS